MTPALILVGFFFGYVTMFFLFVPTAWLYVAHVGNWATGQLGNWAIWQITYRTALLMWVAGWLALQTQS